MSGTEVSTQQRRVTAEAQRLYAESQAFFPGLYKEPWAELGVTEMAVWMTIATKELAKRRDLAAEEAESRHEQERQTRINAGEAAYDLPEWDQLDEADRHTTGRRRRWRRFGPMSARRRRSPSRRHRGGPARLGRSEYRTEGTTMAHEIFGARFYGNRIPAWHGLGTVFEGNKTATQAVTEGGLDYTVTKHPIIIPYGDGQLDTGKVALVREPLADDPQPRIFATGLDKSYGLLQNREIAAMLDGISKDWPVETVGALGFGERIFITLQVGSSAIGGSEVKEYFLVYEAKDGTGAINIKYCTERVVCANTLSMALGDGLETVKLTHSSEVATRMKFEIDLMAALRRAGEDARGVLTSLASTPITEEQAKEVFAAAHPNPKMPRPFRFSAVTPDSVGSTLYMSEHKRANDAKGEWERRVNRIAEFREAAGDLYAKLNDEFPAAAGTAWHALNAVTELADHRPGAVEEMSDRFEESEYTRRQSAMFGTRNAEKVNALAACISIFKEGGAVGESRSKVAVAASKPKRAAKALAV